MYKLGYQMRYNELEVDLRRAVDTGYIKLTKPLADGTIETFKTVHEWCEATSSK